MERLALIPRDGFFCKDGRGWHSSASERGHGVAWPWPSTVLGALRTMWGRSRETVSGQPFGPREWRAQTEQVRLESAIALRRPTGTAWSESQRVWPAPLDGIWLEGRNDILSLQPQPPMLRTLGRTDDEAREAMWVASPEAQGKPRPTRRWWSDEQFTNWLSGQAVEVNDRAIEMSRRVQTHVGIGPETFTAEEGILFSHDVIETLEHEAEWALGVEVAFPAEWSSTVATLGSDRRMAAVETLTPRIFDLPARVLEAFRSETRGLRLIVTTPACFTGGWLFEGFERRDLEFRGRLAAIDGELVLRAAMVARPADMSGWDMAANNGAGAPKPSTRMVPPGSVYFFERCDGRPFAEAEARALWLSAHGTRDGEGFGRVVPGVWNPMREVK
ncbi:MAG: type III-B CRISPR module-associated Cmr3 family protein [Vulcanimicrobiaceae bacterium]